VDKAITEARMAHTGSIDTDTSIVARGILLVRRIIRTNRNRTVKTCICRSTVHGEAFTNSVAERVVSAMVTHTVTIAVIETVIFTA
jgi:hypothetical protein